MAKAKPIPGLDREAPLFVNAALILGTRLNEILDYDRHIGDPEQVYELHQMRIAAKRLRYTMEIFEEVYRSHTVHGQEFSAAVKEIETLQKRLGEIHDADVLVPQLIEHLTGLLQAGYGRNKNREPLVGVHFVDMDACQGLLTLCQETRARRDKHYQLLLDDWRRLRDAQFFDRFRALLRAAITESRLAAVLGDAGDPPADEEDAAAQESFPPVNTEDARATVQRAIRRRPAARAD